MARVEISTGKRGKEGRKKGSYNWREKEGTRKETIKARASGTNGKRNSKFGKRTEDMWLVTKF